MAKKRKEVLKAMAGQGRRRPNLQAKVNSISRDSSIIKYNVVGETYDKVTNWNARPFMRFYIGGLSSYAGSTEPVGFVANAGRDIVKSYSTCKFLPGTTITWSPSVGFTTSGRVFIGFTDNPEVAANIWAQYTTDGSTGNFTNYNNLVKQLGNVVSHQLFEEFTIQVPTRLRRNMFDVNAIIGTNDVDKLDRSGHVFMFGTIEASVPDGTVYGSFLYHDNIMVEGIRAASLT